MSDKSFANAVEAFCKKVEAELDGEEGGVERARLLGLLKECQAWPGVAEIAKVTKIADDTAVVNATVQSEWDDEDKQIDPLKPRKSGISKSLSIKADKEEK